MEDIKPSVPLQAISPSLPTQSIQSQSTQPVQVQTLPKKQSRPKKQQSIKPSLPPLSPQPTQSTQSTQPSQPSQPSQPTTSNQSAPQKPMIVTTTTPQGQIVQYQLNVSKAVYINSKAVNVPVNVNQVYYLQTAATNGEKTVQPHLMTGSNRMADGNVYYCMVPMVPVAPVPAKK